MFEQIQPCPTIISSECDLISTKLAIDWSTGITWSDLRKPLYSGLGAALYMLKQLREREVKVPGTVQGQAEIWSTLFRPGANASAYNFATTNAASNTTENSEYTTGEKLFSLGGSCLCTHSLKCISFFSFLFLVFPFTYLVLFPFLSLFPSICFIFQPLSSPFFIIISVYVLFIFCSLLPFFFVLFSFTFIYPVPLAPFLFNSFHIL